MELDSEKFAADGFAIVNGVFSTEEIERLRECIAAIPDGAEVRRRGSVYGIRNLLENSAAVRLLAAHPSMRRMVEPVLGEPAFAVRAVYFDKGGDANWSLDWHQDKIIAVERRIAAPGFLGWSQKAGVWHVQAPREVLADMAAVRVHLDDCRAENGPLRVLAGSHQGVWNDEEINRWRGRTPETTCLVDCGGVLVMRPLLLHASSRSTSAGRRRVVHIEYARSELPCGLAWKSVVGPSRQA